MKVSELLRKAGGAPVIVHPAVTVRDVVGLLRDGQNGAAIIHTDSGALDGILTERDVLQAIAKHGSASLGLPAAALATTAVASCRPDDNLTDVARTMTERKLHYIAVCQGGRMINVLSIVDVLDERLHDRRRITRAILESGMLIN